MQLGFIDYSKDERNKVLATLSLLGEQNAIDELGIGTIRDAFADILFPGISTLQTRAKYLVIIPYLFNLASKQKFDSGKELLNFIHDKEAKLVHTLINNSEEDVVGIIGSTAIRHKRAVKNKPSSIYWNGLRTYEILKGSNLSISAACDLCYTNAKNKSEILSNLVADKDSFDDSSASNNNRVVFSPIGLDYNIDNDIKITLTKKEAEYLKDKILTAKLSKDTLLAFIIKNNINVNTLDDISIDILPEKIREDFLLAKGFSDFIVGAHIRYNIIYSDYKDEAMMEKYEAWRNNLQLENLDLENILIKVKANNQVFAFCNRFYEALIKDDTDAIDELIIAREKAVKGNRSKLCKPTEFRYDSDRPIHNFKLDYRFRSAKNIINDILIGLGEENV